MISSLGLRNSYAGSSSAHTRSPETKNAFRRSVIMEDSESGNVRHYGEVTSMAIKCQRLRMMDLGKSYPILFIDILGSSSNNGGHSNRNSYSGERLTHSLSRSVTLLL